MTQEKILSLIIDENKKRYFRKSECKFCKNIRYNKPKKNEYYDKDSCFILMPMDKKPCPCFELSAYAAKYEVAHPPLNWVTSFLIKLLEEKNDTRKN